MKPLKLSSRCDICTNKSKIQNRRCITFGSGKTQIKSSLLSLENNGSIPRNTLDRIGDLLGIKDPDDWYKITIEKFKGMGGRGLLSQHNDSLIQTLQSVYPEKDWLPWRFERVPQGYWHNKDNQKKYMEWLGKKLGVKEYQDWYNVKRAIVSEEWRMLSDIYDGSLYAALKAIFPEYNWIPWKFEKVPTNFWDNTVNQRWYFDWAGQNIFNIQGNLENWYQYSATEVQKQRGNFVMMYYNGSLYHALQAAYPDYPWKEWRFKGVSMSIWNSKQNQIEFFEMAAQKLNIKTMDDWYNVKIQDIEHIGGLGVLLQHNHSVIAALRYVFPEHNWLPWKFTKVPKNFWNDMKNQRDFFDWVGKQLNLSSFEDWYSVQAVDIKNLGGRGLLATYYGDSVLEALKKVYPEHNWVAWRFQSVPNSYWETQSEESVRKFVQHISEQLSISTLDDWYRVSITKLKVVPGADALLTAHKGLYNLLAKCYPHHQWDMMKLNSKYKKAAQRTLLITLQRLFPGQEIHEDYQHPKLAFKNTNRSMQFDIYFPAKNIAFEYQGEHHFHNLFYFGPQQQFRKRDEEKSHAASELGIKLIRIPYWWDEKIESLAATIKEFIPDARFGISVPKAKPIPPVPSEDHLKNKTGSKVLMLATEWSDNLTPSQTWNPEGWLMSHKPSGIQLRWNPALRCFQTSKEKVFPVPDSVSAIMPDYFLDGYLWLGANRYEELLALAHAKKPHFKKKPNLDWSTVKYFIVDVISNNNSNTPQSEMPFEKRLEVLKDLKNTNKNSHLQYVEPIPCQGLNHAYSFLSQSTDDKQSSGVLFSDPAAPYQTGWSTTRYKMEHYYLTEVTVISSHKHGLLCKQANGVECVVWCPTFVKDDPPKQGSKVTVQYLGEWQTGKLKYPYYFGEESK